MLRQLLNGGFSLELLLSILLSLPIVLFSLSCHEVAHGYVAYKMGDPTARNLGRLTLNPMKHLDPMGTILMLLVGYGWAKPVPINTRFFKNPKKGMALTALAGPLTNFFLGFVFLIITAAYSVIINTFVLNESTTEFAFVIMSTIFQVLYFGAYMNVTLAVFNLLPVPPFDGSRIFLSFLPPKLYFGIMKYERYILIVVLALFYLDILTIPVSFITDRIFSLMLTLIGIITGL